MFKTRIKTGAILLIVASLALCFSHIPLILDGAIAFLSICAVWEMGQAFGIRTGALPILLSVAELLVLLIIPEKIFLPITGIFFLVTAVYFIVQMIRFHSIKGFGYGSRILIFLSIPVFFSSMKCIRTLPGGLYTLTIAVFVCMITDSFAYLVGRRFGRHKMAPSISPSKTIEGCLGGTAATAAFVLLAVLFADTFWNFSASYGILLVYLLLTSMVAQFGDLCMSVVKRVMGIKDYSQLLPGHGGILDRFDSLLFVLPFTYLFCSLIVNIF